MQGGEERDGRDERPLGPPVTLAGYRPGGTAPPGYRTRSGAPAGSAQPHAPRTPAVLAGRVISRPAAGATQTATSAAESAAPAAAATGPAPAQRVGRPQATQPRAATSAPPRPSQPPRTRRARPIEPDLSIGGTVREAFGQSFRLLGPALILGVLGYAPAAALYGVAVLIGEVGLDGAPRPPIGLLVMLFLTLGGPFFLAGALDAVAQRRRTGRIEVVQMLARGATYAVPLLALNALLTLPLIAAATLLATWQVSFEPPVPVVVALVVVLAIVVLVVALRALPASAAMVVERLGPVRGFARAWAMTRGQGTRILAATLLWAVCAAMLIGAPPVLLLVSQQVLAMLAAVPVGALLSLFGALSMIGLAGSVHGQLEQRGRARFEPGPEVGSGRVPVLATIWQGLVVGVRALPSVVLLSLVPMLALALVLSFVVLPDPSRVLRLPNDAGLVVFAVVGALSTAFICGAALSAFVQELQFGPHRMGQALRVAAVQSPALLLLLGVPCAALSGLALAIEAATAALPDRQMAGYLVGGAPLLTAPLFAIWLLPASAIQVTERQNPLASLDRAHRLTRGVRLRLTAGVGLICLLSAVTNLWGGLDRAIAAVSSLASTLALLGFTASAYVRLAPKPRRPADLF